MTIIIVFACLLVGLVAGIVFAKITNVLSPGKAIAVGAITGLVLAAAAVSFVGIAGAGAALVGAIVGSIVYVMLIALALGGC